jgi:L-rhamnose mutarotase
MMPNTETVAFVMYLKAGNEAEYQRRHNEIWPELAAALRAAGIVEYKIFLEPHSRQLFAVQKRLPGHTTSALPQLPIMRKWWDYMADLMEVNEDNSPVERELREVFDLGDV